MLPFCAQAQQEGAFILSIEGNYQFNETDGYTYATDPGPAFNPRKIAADDSGFGGEIRAGYQFSPAFDIFAGFDVTLLHGKDSPAGPGTIQLFPSAPAISTTSSAEEDTELYIVDFEFGWRPNLENNWLRLFAGIRGVYLDRQVDISATAGAATLSIDRENEFYGAGPRVGFEGVLPLAGSINLTASGSVAAMLGHRTMDQDPTSSIPVLSTNPPDREETTVAFSGDLELGFQFVLDPGFRGSGVVLNAGYQGRIITGMVDTQGLGPSGVCFVQGCTRYAQGDRGDEYITHGPFIELVIHLN